MKETKFTKGELQAVIQIEWKLSQENERVCQLTITLQVEKRIQSTVNKHHFTWPITQIALKSMSRVARYRGKMY